MLLATVIRWSGLFAILGGLLFPLAAILHPNGEDLASVGMPNWVPAHLLGWLSVTLMHLGLLGLYARQANRAGWIGMLGFLLAFVGGAFAATIQYVAATSVPLIAAQAPALFSQATTPPLFAAPMLVLGFVLGHILFGLATMRAGVLPRWSGLLVMVGVVLFFLGEASFLSQGASDPTTQDVFAAIRSLHVIVLLGDAAFGPGFAWMGLRSGRRSGPWPGNSRPVLRSERLA